MPTGTLFAKPGCRPELLKCGCQPFCPGASLPSNSALGKSCNSHMYRPQQNTIMWLNPCLKSDLNMHFLKWSMAAVIKFSASFWRHPLVAFCPVSRSCVFFLNALSKWANVIRVKSRNYKQAERYLKQRLECSSCRCSRHSPQEAEQQSLHPTQLCWRHLSPGCCIALGWRSCQVHSPLRRRNSNQQCTWGLWPASQEKCFAFAQGLWPVFCFCLFGTLTFIKSWTHCPEKQEVYSPGSRDNEAQRVGQYFSSSKAKSQTLLWGTPWGTPVLFLPRMHSFCASSPWPSDCSWSTPRQNVQ